MDNIPEILKIIEGGLQKDSFKVLNYAALLTKKLEESGDKGTAKRIKTVIHRTKTLELNPKRPFFTARSPVDSESRLPLAEFEHFDDNEIFISLSPDAFEDVDEFIKLINHGNELTKEDVKLYRSLLLYGSPGTGKSQTAKFIASKTGLPLVTLRIDGIMSSYLGNTSKNIKTLFDFVEKTPCILFLDEFDAIAKMRDDSNELGELKRVVNSLLQNIDSIKNKLPVIAATNHEHLLDPAVWRRFDYKILLESPKNKQRYEIIKNMLNSKLNGEGINSLLMYMTEGMNGAEIEIFIDGIKTKAILNKIKNIDERYIFDIFVKYRNRSYRKERDDYPDQLDKISIAKSLRKANQKFFGVRMCAKLLGVSKSTAHIQLKEGNWNG